MRLNIPFKIMSIYSTIWMRAKARVIVKGTRGPPAAEARRKESLPPPQPLHDLRYRRPDARLQGAFRDNDGQGSLQFPDHPPHPPRGGLHTPRQGGLEAGGRGLPKALEDGQAPPHLAPRRGFDPRRMGQAPDRRHPPRPPRGRQALSRSSSRSRTTESAV